MQLIQDPESPAAAGIYFDKDENGVYDISFAEDFYSSEDDAVAVVFHELSHVKLVGETDPELNDEFLTDLAGLFFGGGVFLTNASFTFQKSMDGWGYLRQEEEPIRAVHLRPTSLRDFQEFSAWIADNESMMFLSTRQDADDDV